MARQWPLAGMEVLNVKWNSILDRLTATPGKAILMADTCRVAPVTGPNKPKRAVNFDQILKEVQNEYRGLVTFAASTASTATKPR